jgi:hypothetical protein
MIAITASLFIYAYVPFLLCDLVDVNMCLSACLPACLPACLSVHLSGRQAGLPAGVNAFFHSGGFDFVFLHPEYLRDRSGGSLLATLRANGCKIAAYGYEPAGFARELIEGAGIGIYMPGPTPQGADPTMLLRIVAEMQGGAGHVPMGGTIGAIPVCNCCQAD